MKQYKQALKEIMDLTKVYDDNIFVKDIGLLKTQIKKILSEYKFVGPEVVLSMLFQKKIDVETDGEKLLLILGQEYLKFPIETN